jgi:hypothetical protein
MATHVEVLEMKIRDAVLEDAHAAYGSEAVDFRTMRL